MLKDQYNYKLYILKTNLTLNYKNLGINLPLNYPHNQFIIFFYRLNLNFLFFKH